MVPYFVQVAKMHSNRTVVSSEGDPRMTSISFRQYLLPKDTEDMNQSYKRLAHHLLDRNVVSVVGDAAVPEPEVTLFRKVINWYRRLGVVIRPDNKYLPYWLTIQMLIIIYYIIEVGLLLGFGNAFWQDEINTLLGLHIAFILILAVNILISPLKAFYSEGLLIKDISLILKRYAKFEIYIDLLGILAIMLPLFIQNVHSNWIKLLWFLKLYSLSQINKEFQRMTQLYIVSNTIFLVIKLVIYSVFYAHFMGILFYRVSLALYDRNYYGPNTPNILWITNSEAFYNMVFLPWYQMYVYIMYYSIAVVTTIAYGDVTPKNPIEVMFTILALISQAVLWGYILSEILRLLVNVYTYNFERQYHHYALNFKLKESRISQTTFRQVQKHTQEIDRDQQYRNRNIQDNILTFLPPDPLYGLLLVIYKDYLKKIGFTFVQELTYKSIGPADYKSVFLQSFMKKIKEERHFAGDVFYTEGQIENSKPGNHCAYFFTHEHYKQSVVLGVGNHIKISLDPYQSEYLVVEEKGAFELYRPETVFGTVEFLNGQQRSHWAICLQNCLVFKIERKALLEDYSLLTLQEKQFLALNTEKAPTKKCLICKQQHYFLSCPFGFAISKIVLEETANVKRVELLRTNERSRFKTMSAWRLFPEIGHTKMGITNEYKHRLYMSTTDHDLFVELELEEDLEKEEEELEHEIHQTQIIIDNLYHQELQELGLNQEQRSYQQAYNYKFYKPENNIHFIQKNITRYKIANAPITSQI